MCFGERTCGVIQATPFLMSFQELEAFPEGGALQRITLLRDCSVFEYRLNPFLQNAWRCQKISKLIFQQ